MVTSKGRISAILYVCDRSLSVIALVIENPESILILDDLKGRKEAIKFRIEQMGYNQTDLIKVVGLKSRASEILNKKN